AGCRARAGGRRTRPGGRSPPGRRPAGGRGSPGRGPRRPGPRTGPGRRPRPRGSPASARRRAGARRRPAPRRAGSRPGWGAPRAGGRPRFQGRSGRPPAGGRAGRGCGWPWSYCAGAAAGRGPACGGRARGLQFRLLRSPSVKTRGEVPRAMARRNQPDQSPLKSSTMKTFTAKNETVQRDWYVVDATGKTLGRLSSELARRLRGKHKPVYTPHVDTGDYIVVVNAEKIAVTGKKLSDKLYHRFTGHIGNLKTETLAQALERHPERVIETAVKGMLPKNPLGRAMYRKLKVYRGPEHPHAAQQPQPLDI